MPERASERGRCSYRSLSSDSSAVNAAGTTWSLDKNFFSKLFFSSFPESLFQESSSSAAGGDCVNEILRGKRKIEELADLKTDVKKVIWQKRKVDARKMPASHN